MRRLLPALALAAAFAASASQERSEAIFPPQTIPLRFDHGQHLKAGADCLSCHDRARKSARTSDWNLPAHPECEACHDIKAAEAGRKTDPDSRCATCHPGFDHTARAAPPRVQVPAANLIFNHQAHVSRKISCETCHQDMSQVGLATVQQLPKMAACLGCHDGATASAACTTCHQREPSGRLQTTFASGALRPMAGNPYGIDHGPRFEFNHAALASAARATCTACHAERECQKCHDGLRKPLSVHPNDWISLHPLQARSNLIGCESCHRMQSFCAACHARSGVAQEAALLPRTRLVHPDRDAWVGVVNQRKAALGPNHHGFHAARDIRSCMSCHREETCLQCHSKAPTLMDQGVNPHPAGFARICRRAARANDRGCLLCHTASDLRGKGCE